MSKKTFGTTSKGVEASLYEISNGGGLRVPVSYTHLLTSLFAASEIGQTMTAYINDSMMLKYLYENNPVIKLIENIPVSYTHLR